VADPLAGGSASSKVAKLVFADSSSVKEKIIFSRAPCFSCGREERTAYPPSKQEYGSPSDRPFDALAIQSTADNGTESHLSYVPPMITFSPKQSYAGEEV
jgi:hypothetical protein